MAKGYPDYYGIPMFPSYLGTVQTKLVVNVTDGEETTLVAVTGKGLLHHAEVYSSDASMNNNHVMRLYLDDAIVAWIGISNAAKLSPFVAQPNAWFAARYDNTSGDYRLMLDAHLPFATNAYVTFLRTGAINVALTSDLMYSLIAD